MGEEVFSFLHVLKTVQPRSDRNNPPQKPMIVEGHVRCLYPVGSVGVIAMTTEGNHFYLLEELAASEVLAVRNFIMRRLSEPDRKSLQQLIAERRVKRKDLLGVSVVVQHDRFSVQSPAKLLYHASNGYRHLGDCWLVKFLGTRGNQSTQFIPSKMIYRASEFNPLPIG